MYLFIVYRYVFLGMEDSRSRAFEFYPDSLLIHTLSVEMYSSVEKYAPAKPT